MYKDRPNGWWINSSDEQKKFIRDTSRSNKNKKSRNEMHFCNSCSKVWDTLYMVGFKTYEDMPTYGLKRKQCKNCKEK